MCAPTFRSTRSQVAVRWQSRFRHGKTTGTEPVEGLVDASVWNIGPWDGRGATCGHHSTVGCVGGWIAQPAQLAVTLTIQPGQMLTVDHGEVLRKERG